MERNLILYDWFLRFRGLHFWTPVFFLYFSQFFTVAEILQLEAIYYVAVVILEVPSGYFSDRLGRVITLRISALAFVVAYGLFYVGELFEVFVLAQISLATAYVFSSGTDVSFHYDTLHSLSRTDEFAVRQARLTRNAFYARAIASLTGGIVAVIALDAVYLLSLLAAFGPVLLSLYMQEPSREEHGRQYETFSRQLQLCFSYARRGWLAWLFGFVVLKTIIEHLPYEFGQPYIAVTLGERADQLVNAPWISGLIFTAVAIVGGIAASYSVSLRDRFGTTKLLLGLTLLQTLLISAMALLFHPLIAFLLVFRSVQGAIANVVVDAEVAPKIPQQQRATYFSLQSLTGRLAFSLSLLFLSLLPGTGEAFTHDGLQSVLLGSTAIAALGLFVLAISSRLIRPDTQD